MKVFFDTNILIDFLAEREPFVDDAALILGMCEQKHKKRSPECRFEPTANIC